MSDAGYEVYAVQYAKSLRPSADYFLGADPHDGPRPIFYYVWVVRDAERVIVVDTGFDAARAETRGRDFIRCPTEGLRSLGIDATSVESVVLTHLHYDHAGNLERFPAARFVLQDEEMRFATGRSMRFAMMRAAFELADVLGVVTHNYAGRVRFVAGTEEIAPGVHVHLVPGHTRGLQVVTVETARGTLCLASDAAHFYANIGCENPFPVITDVAMTLEGHERVLELAGHRASHLIPGHDPAIMDLYPALDNDPLVRDLTVPPDAAACERLLDR